MDTLTVTPAPFGLSPTGTPNPPHSSQEKIFAWADAVREGTLTTTGMPTLYVQGGWRSGKTRACLAVMEELMEDYPGIRVLMARKDFNDLRLSTIESWKAVRPEEHVASYDQQEHREEWHTGSQVFFRELKDLHGLGGQEFGAILISEPHELEEGVVPWACGRLSQAGMPLMLILEGNPPNAGHWLHRMVKGDPDHGVEPDPSVTFLEIPTDDNWANLPVAYRQSIESSPASWQKKYRLGQFGFTPEGQPVYSPPFAEALHVRPCDFVPDRPVIRSWDSGVRHPACLWSQLTASGRLLIQYEWLGMEMGLETFAPGVVQRTNEWYGARVASDVGDPAMFARSPQTGRSDAQLLQKFGVQLRGRQSTHQERKALIDQRLSLLIDGQPAIVIHPRCRTLIDGLLGGYHYPRKTDQQAFGPKHEIPYKDGFFDHLANCFEYLLITHFGQQRSVVTKVVAARQERLRRQRLQQRTTVAF